MLRKLRITFTAITMSLLALVLLTVMALLYLSSARSFDNLVYRTLQQAIESEDAEGAQEADQAIGFNGNLPQVPVFVIRGHVNENGPVIDTDLEGSGVDAESVRRGTISILNSEADDGRGWDNGIRWMRIIKENDFVVAVAGLSGINAALRGQLLNSVAVFFIAMVLLAFATWNLSGWAFAPVEKSMAQQRQFIADASHELKTPLAVIIANLQILGHSSMALDADARDWIARTDEEAHRMQGLITDMLELAKTEADENPVDRTEDVDLSSLVEKVALQLDALAYERGVSISADVTGDIHVRGNQGELDRLAMTLLDNACKYASPRTEVRICLSRQGDMAELLVNNRGNRIDEADLPHVFERFFRSDRSRTSTPDSGYGLGLAIAKGIAEAHGGTIGVTSDERDGTTFSVSIPIAPGAV